MQTHFSDNLWREKTSLKHLVESITTFRSLPCVQSKFQEEKKKNEGCSHAARSASGGDVTASRASEPLRLVLSAGHLAIHKIKRSFVCASAKLICHLPAGRAASILSFLLFCLFVCCFFFIFSRSDERKYDE